MNTNDQWQENHREFMSKTLTKAADHFCVTLQGDPTFGWHDRSIGSQVSGEKGNYWIRLVSENTYWVQDDWWESNVTADAIQDISKPKVIDVYEWKEGDIRFRAELMELAEGRVCSPTSEIRKAIDLPNRWWTDLRQSLDVISVHPTERVKVKQEKASRRFLVFYGDDVNSKITHWATAHGDFHWGNLMAPKLTILDWEGWGQAPAGMDAAYLYCFSLLVPEVAKQVYQTFADILDSESGIIAQLYVITCILKRIEQGDFVDLAGPLHRLAKKLITRRE